MLTALSEITGRNPTVDDLFVAEEICFTYYANPVISIIKQIYKKSKSDERIRLGYYVQPIVSIIKQKRKSDTWTMNEHDKRVYWFVTTRYLIDDFNHDQLVQLRDLCRFPYDDIEEAARISKNEQVYSIPYLYRVVEGIQARKAEKMRQLQERRKMFYVEQNEHIIKRSRLDIAKLEAQWLKQCENAELMRMVNELYGGSDQ